MIFVLGKRENSGMDAMYLKSLGKTIKPFEGTDNGESWDKPRCIQSYFSYNNGIIYNYSCLVIDSTLNHSIVPGS